jgi:hypothetical protein
MSDAVVKLGGVELRVERIGLVSGQNVAWLSPAGAKALAQDWGPKGLEFRLEGWIPAARGLAGFFELRGVQSRREPVALRIDENSWEVQLTGVNGTEESGGEVSVDIACTEVGAPATLVFALGPELGAAEVSEEYLRLLRLRGQVFWWRGISERVAGWIGDAVAQVATIRGLLSEAVSLVELPAATIGNIRAAAQLCAAAMESVIAEVGDIFDGGLSYTPDEEELKAALALAEGVRAQMALLSAACGAVPRAEDVALVEQGETLQRLAERLSAERGRDVDWVELARANGIEDPGTVEAGMEVVVPG